jgi:hypothetical protein
MYAFTPTQKLCLVYEDFYLAIGYAFNELKKLTKKLRDFNDWRNKKSLDSIQPGSALTLPEIIKRVKKSQKRISLYRL